MWRRIAEAEKQGKYVDEADIIAEMGYEDINSDCFLCEFTGGDSCNICPIDWTNGGKTEENHCSPGYYVRWLTASDDKKAAELAEIIAELPEKTEREV